MTLGLMKIKCTAAVNKKALGLGQKRKITEQYLHHLLSISSLNWIHSGGTENSEIRHKTKINIQKKEYHPMGRKKTLKA